MTNTAETIAMNATTDTDRNVASPGAQGLCLDEGLLHELSREGALAYSLPQQDVPRCDPEDHFPDSLLRKRPAALPELSEADLVRHFTRLSAQNYCKDAGFFPLGSCTMKHNPRINEAAAALPGFSYIHPYQDSAETQAALELTHALEAMLAEISGMADVSTRPAAGSHGELVGLMMIRAYLQDQGDARKAVIIPDSAHGTNPASAAICGYDVIEVKSGPDGILHPEDVAAVMTEDVAAIMITNPNTLGLFESNIAEIVDIVHGKGGQVYCDGANLNAVLGVARPGDAGIDVMHFNLHKTFTTPHGGGGPGSGPVGVAEHLIPYLPIPHIANKDGELVWDEDRPQSIGRVKAFYGNFGMFVRAFTYIREMGPEGLRKVSEYAVLNANYIRALLEPHFHLPFVERSLHECVFTDKWQQAHGVKTLDIAKRLMDYGFHPPTVYFPLLISGAMMIEPTETESRFACDQFVAAMQQIAREAQNAPDVVTSAPSITYRTRLDEVRASRKPCLRWQDMPKEDS